MAVVVAEREDDAEIDVGLDAGDVDDDVDDDAVEQLKNLENPFEWNLNQDGCGMGMGMGMGIGNLLLPSLLEGTLALALESKTNNPHNSQEERDTRPDSSCIKIILKKKLN